MKAKEYFLRIGQSDADRNMPSRTRRGQDGTRPGMPTWTDQQINWYCSAYYYGLKPKEILRKAVMDEVTLTALKGSITKWQHIVDGTGRDKGPDNCPLCQIFHSMFRVDDEPCCNGCPVAAAVNAAGCEGTPYADFVRVETEEEMIAAAKRELAFLISLLPKE